MIYIEQRPPPSSSITPCPRGALPQSPPLCTGAQEAADFPRRAQLLASGLREQLAHPLVCQGLVAWSSGSSRWLRAAALARELAVSERALERRF